MVDWFLTTRSAPHQRGFLGASFRILSDPGRLFFPFFSPPSFPREEPARRLGRNHLPGSLGFLICPSTSGREIRIGWEWQTRQSKVSLIPQGPDARITRSAKAISLASFTGDPNAVLVIHNLKIKMFSFTCVPVSFLAGLEAIWIRAKAVYVVSFKR